MCYIQENGKFVYVADGKYIDGENSAQDAKFGLLATDLKAYADRGQATKIAQFYELVIPGLILARHIFWGLERPLYCDGNADGDELKYVYSRKPTFDVIWVGGRNGIIKRIGSSPNRVFVTIVSKNARTKEYPSIFGWLEGWNWVEEDPYLSEAPDNWVDRYKRKVWTRE